MRLILILLSSLILALASTGLDAKQEGDGSRRNNIGPFSKYSNGNGTLSVRGVNEDVALKTAITTLNSRELDAHGPLDEPTARDSGNLMVRGQGKNSRKKRANAACRCAKGKKRGKNAKGKSCRCKARPGKNAKNANKTNKAVNNNRNNQNKKNKNKKNNINQATTSRVIVKTTTSGQATTRTSNRPNPTQARP